MPPVSTSPDRSRRGRGPRIGRALAHRTSTAGDGAKSSGLLDWCRTGLAHPLPGCSPAERRSRWRRTVVEHGASD
jgi:hypothetical protein